MPLLPTIIDLEASGFGRGSYPIEVGFVPADGHTYCSLILPAPHWRHWDDAAQAVHQITRDTLMLHGRPASDVARTLNQRLRGQTVYSDGWANDYSWLGLLFDEADITPAFKLDNLRALLNDRQADGWQACKERVIAELRQPRHRASNDARVLQVTFQRLCAQTD